MAQNPNLIFTNASANQTSAVFDGYSESPVEVQVSVTGGVLTAGTLKSQTSLDNSTWDNTTWAYNFTYGDMNNGVTKVVPQGYPFIKFTLASLAFNYGKTQTVGSGLSDLTAAGTYSALTAHYYDIVISTAAGTDKFTWAKDGGTASAQIAITGSAQTIADGLTVQFGATTGHTLNNAWRITPPSINVTMILGPIVGDVGPHAYPVATPKSTDPGVAGTFLVDSSYLYYNTGSKWVRLAADTGVF